MFSAMSCSPKVMKIFVPADAVVVALGDGLRAHRARSEPACGSVEAHRAGPLARDELGDEALLLLVRADQLDRFDRALVEQRAVGEADVGGVPHLERRAEQQSAASPGRRTPPATGKPDPAGLGELLVGFFEARAAS